MGITGNTLHSYFLRERVLVIRIYLMKSEPKMVLIFLIDIFEEFSETTAHEIYKIYEQETDLLCNHFAKKKKKKSLKIRPFYTSH